jgi:hypothetical protein
MGNGMNELLLSRRRFLGCALIATAGYGGVFGVRADELVRSAGPYVPTPQVIVDRMLQSAKVGPNDFVIDLGSGDGRLVRTAARVYGASGFGVDIDRELVQKSNVEAQREGVANRVSFREQDVFKADIRKATVVTLYVLPEMMVQLRPKMLAELRPGTRIVSHDYHFREWTPDNRWSFDVPEKREMVGFSGTNIYLWIVPAHVAGRWRLQLVGEKSQRSVTLAFNQLFQQLSGAAHNGERTSEIAGLRLRGDELEFTLDLPPFGGSAHFRGKVANGGMDGEVAWGSTPLAKRAKWHAERIEVASEPLAR